jgi:arabinofuranosyltransferase
MSALTAVLRRYWPVLLATAVLVPHALLFDFVSDDAYISFRYARNLARHGQLVFNLGERVEGFTNFLWTVLLAGGIKLGISPVVSSRFLGVAFAVGTLAVAVRISLWLDRERPSPFHLVAPLGLAAMGSFACWASGGLETQLFTFLALLAFAWLMVEIDQRRGFASGVCFALAAMTRPEGVLLFGLAGLVRLALNLRRERRLLPRRHEVEWVAAFLVLFAPYFAWRWRYYGWPFPNTFYVKSSGGAGTLANGVFYLRRFAEDYGVFFLGPLALLGWPSHADRRRRTLFFLGAVVWTGFGLYTLKVGGDFMGLYRFVLPVVPLGVLVLQEAVRVLAARLGPFVPGPVLGLAGAMLVAGFLASDLKVDRVATTVSGADGGIIDTPAYLKQYALSRIPVGIWLGQHARPDDLMTVGGAGVIPYYSGIAAYDVFGLVDEHIAHDPRMNVGDRAGHQKWGSDAYMLSRHPTLITHRYCLYGPCREERWPYPGYEWVHFTAPGIQPVYYSFMKRLDRAFGPFPARTR